jgi:23S rRNA (cytidine2498-2'-O)-methyltransferase
MSDSATFLFAVCQVGVEWALKEEVARRWPQLHFAYSRPGFVTFKDQSAASLVAPTSPNPLVGSVFARTCGYSVGKIVGENEADNVERFWQMVADISCSHLHLWQRDHVVPGERGFVPGPSEIANQLGERMLAAAPPDSKPKLNALAKAGETVVDCVLVEPNAWWVGVHRAESVPQRWPGGAPLLTPPDDMISRAYLKTCEALAWSRLPAQAGDTFVELGCAPGGSSQALLDRGYVVTGIDPADVDERLRGRAGFTHLRKRSAEVKRKEFRHFRWLLADLNVAPEYTLTAVEDIVARDEVQIDGLVLTLKLMDREHYAQVGDFLTRVRSWGFEDVRARQLAFNRQELCVAALKNKSLRRGKPPRQK